MIHIPLPLLAFSALCTIGQHPLRRAVPQPEESGHTDVATEVLTPRAEEMLQNTRHIVFIDSLVTHKDDFLSALRLTDDAGHFALPDRLFQHNADEHAFTTGQCAYLNPRSSAVWFSQTDTTGEYRLCAAYRNGNLWSLPQPLPGLGTYRYADCPFVAADGVTLYFAAETDEGLGGLDLYVTRFNTDTRQYVRPENMGFPFNSTANDYLLATDENAGIGVLVTDRRQPDDKVCLYWFLLEGLLQGTPYSPPETAADPESLRRAAAEIVCIADSQQGWHEKIAQNREQWAKALAHSTPPLESAEKNFFVIADNLVYRSLQDFRNPQARNLAQQWAEGQRQAHSILDELQKLRKQYAGRRNEKTALRIRNLEQALHVLTIAQQKLAKDFRRLEHGDRHEEGGNKGKSLTKQEK